MIKEHCVLAEEFIVVDPPSSLWNAARPLLEAALRLEGQKEEGVFWHGWDKRAIQAFLQELPTHCTLLVGVWNMEEEGQEREALMVGFICEVRGGEVCTLRTLEALWTEAEKDLPPIQELEPGYQHGLALLRAARQQIAPVAWALFTDWATWNEWIYAEDEQGGGSNKGEILETLARQGRCVLMGSQTSHHP
jgi:hypothetical protein